MNDSSPEPNPQAPRSRLWWRRFGVLAAVLVAVLIAASFVKVHYVIVSPGAATPLDDRVITVSGVRTYAHDQGQLLYLTVRVTDQDPSVVRYLFAKLDGDVDVVKKADVLGCASYAADARLNRFLMQASQADASSVALRKLGYSLDEVDRRAIVRDVDCQGPARDRLQSGDVITAVGGAPVTTAEDVGPLVRAHEPGEVITVTVMRGDRSHDVSVRLGSNGGTARLGIVTQTIREVSSPVDVRIDTRRVSGPSAGLAFTLAIIDDLTPGNLTGGRRVAVTGTINPDGTVGEVGGVAQKAVTARDQGATLMLVPQGEERVAKEQVGDDLRVVGVRTIDDALAALRDVGGDAVT